MTRTVIVSKVKVKEDVFEITRHSSLTLNTFGTSLAQYQIKNMFSKPFKQEVDCTSQALAPNKNNRLL